MAGSGQVEPGPQCGDAAPSARRIAEGGWPITRHRWLLALGSVTALTLFAGVFLFPWSWLIPLVERQSSTAIGRRVTVRSIEVALGGMTVVTLRDVVVANPEGFEADAPFARVASAVVSLDAWASLRGFSPIISAVTLQGLDVEAVTRADGTTNSDFGAAALPAETPSSALPIGAISLRDGRARIRHAPLRADFVIQIETRPVPAVAPAATVPARPQPQSQAASTPTQEEAPAPENATAPPAPERFYATARGTYAGAPLTAQLTGGTVLGVADEANPWPLELAVENGTTRASLRGTIRNPLALAGADLRLELSGPDMRFLTPLTGVPMPSTAAFRAAGRLSYGERRFHFTEIRGQVGNSDLGGTVTIAPRTPRPDVTMDIQARQLDMADLAGLIGGNPGRGRPIRDDTPTSGRVLPDAPVNLPLFRTADVHARLRAARIIGGDAPFDNLDATLELIDGVLTLRPLRGGVGSGAVIVTATLTPRADGQLHAVGDIELQQLDIGRIMQTLGGRGGGALNGRARIDSVGRSTAQLLAHGNGGMTLHTSGGSLSALSMDLAGLRLGNAIFSAFGLPARTSLECFVADFALERGVLNTRTLLLETSDALILGTGSIRLDEERLDLRLRSEAKHFTIASLPASIAVRGSLNDPSVLPVATDRRSLGPVLDLALSPLSFVPIIEFGIGEDPRCRAMLERARRPLQGVPAPRAPARPGTR